jgi:isopentenyldiphosphate isomerase
VSRAWNVMMKRKDAVLTSQVDYILFTTIDVDTELNLNEVSDAKYVSRQELEEMFADQSEPFATLSSTHVPC